MANVDLFTQVRSPGLVSVNPLKSLTGAIPDKSVGEALDSYKQHKSKEGKGPIMYHQVNVEK